jgi:hypothetical protein
MKHLAEAWTLLSRDLRTHPSGPDVYLRSGPSESGPLDHIGLTPDEADAIERINVGMIGGIELGGGIERSGTREAGIRTLAAVAGCVQDVVEESSHGAWPRCPTHGRSASVEVHDGRVVVWSCRSGDWVVPVGSLASDGTEPPS